MDAASSTPTSPVEAIATAAAKDAFFKPSDNPGLFERSARALINDPRDWPFVQLAVTASLCIFPLAAGLFYLRTFPWWYAGPYLAFLFLVFVDKFILMLHNTSHRPLFKRKYRLLNYYIPWVLGPFCGESPESYFVHHVGMHHPENNLEDDLSTTMHAQRDNFFHFLAYFFTFLIRYDHFGGYFYTRKRYSLLRRFLMGEGSFWLAVIGLSFWSLQATTVVFIAPFLIVRFLMMCGNWGQHAFIDQAAPENEYRNSITCIDSRYNRRCFNDGYHIGHHLRPTMHWTEMPGEFTKNLDKYAREGAFVFHNTDFFMVWLLLMTRQYRIMARMMVHLGNDPRPSEDELVARLKERLKPVERALPVAAIAA